MTRHASAPGATLLLVMIVLILMAMFAASIFRIASNNLRVVGNMQTKQEATAAAQLAIELVIGSSAFITDPDLVSQSPVDVDIEGDGTVDYVVRFSPKPSCYRVTPSASCGPAAPSSGGMSGTLIEGPTGSVTAANTCYLKEWNVRAVVEDARTGATVAINQGVSVPSSNNTCQ